MAVNGGLSTDGTGGDFQTLWVGGGWSNAIVCAEKIAPTDYLEPAAGLVAYRHNELRLVKYVSRESVLEALVSSTGMHLCMLGVPADMLASFTRGCGHAPLHGLEQLLCQVGSLFRLHPVVELIADCKWTALFGLTEGIYLVVTCDRNGGSEGGHCVVYDAWRDLLIVEPGRELVVRVQAVGKTDEGRARAVLAERYSLGSPLHAAKLMVDTTRILETKFNTPAHYLALEEGRASNRNSASVAVVARRKRRRRVASFPAYRGGGMAALDAPPAAAPALARPRAHVSVLEVRMVLYEADCAGLIAMGAPADEYSAYAPALQAWVNAQPQQPSVASAWKQLQPMVDSFEVCVRSGRRYRVLDRVGLLQLAVTLVQLWRGDGPRRGAGALREHVELELDAVMQHRPERRAKAAFGVVVDLLVALGGGDHDKYSYYNHAVLDDLLDDIRDAMQCAGKTERRSRVVTFLVCRGGGADASGLVLCRPREPTRGALHPHANPACAPLTDKAAKRSTHEAVPKSSLPHKVRLSSPLISSYVRHASRCLSSHPILGMPLIASRLILCCQVTSAQVTSAVISLLARSS